MSLAEDRSPEVIQSGRATIVRPYTLTRRCFESDEWTPTGRIVANREVKTHPEWGEGVWWSDSFGVCSPFVAGAKGGPLGHRDDLA